MTRLEQLDNTMQKLKRKGLITQEVYEIHTALLEAVGVLKQIDAIHPKDSILAEVKAARTVLERLK